MKRKIALILTLAPLVVCLTGCGIHPFGLGAGSHPSLTSTTTTTTTLNGPAWALVSWLSIAGMVTGVVIMCAPIPTPRPLRGASIVGTALACLLLSNLMRQYEHLLTMVAAGVFGLGLLALGYFLWTHRRQLREDATTELNSLGGPSATGSPGSRSASTWSSADAINPSPTPAVQPKS